MTLQVDSGGAGAGSYTYSLTGPDGGPLPAGLSFDPMTRVLSGTPTAPGNTVLTYRIVDTAGASAEAFFTVAVAAAPPAGTTPTLTIEDISLTEGQQAAFSVVLSQAVTGGFSVAISPAASGTRYLIVPATLTFAGTAGEMQGSVVTALDNSNADGDLTETLNFTASGDAGGVVDDSDTALLTVKDDETAAADTTLSAFGLTAGGAAVTLTPTFAAGTAHYTASVANDVSTVTVTATAAASGATVALTPADADTNTSGHQITLSEGATTIWAVVTNGGDTGSYSIVVTRAAAADNTAPTVVSIERHNGTDAQAEHTNADTLTFRVTFSEAVENVSTDGSDFDATGTTGDASATAVVTGNDAQYIVTVSGGDLASYDGTVGLAFAAGQDIEDAAKNALTSTTPSGANHTYTVDNTAPTLTVTAPAGHDGSAAFNVTVAFSENVSGFGDVATDVSVTGGTLTDGTNSITGTDAQSYTVNITPSGTANVTVQVIASAATDSAGNGNTASGTVTVTYEATDSTAPTVVSVERDDGAGNDPGEHTNADTLTFRVTFSEAVENVSTDGSDFDATGTTGDATAAAVVTGNDAQYIVTVSGGDLATLDGEVSLTFASGQDIEDADKNDLDATLPTGDDYETYTVDNTRPTVMMMGPTRHDGSTAFVVNIVFSEDMGGTFAGTQDFALTGGSFANGDADITATDGRNYTARITPNGMSEVIVKVGETQARDAAGNGNLAAPDLTVPYGDPSDTTAPTVASIERDDGAGNDPGERTNADSLRFRVTFSEAVQNVDTADFGASGTTATATGVSGSGTTRIVTVGGGDLADLDATVGLTFASGQNIQDLAVNALASTTPSGVNETYTVDNTRPTVMMTGPASHDGSTAFDVSIVFSEDMGGTFAGTLDFAVTGGRFANGDADITATANDGRNYRARITPNGEAEVIVSVGATQATDAAGNGNLAAPDLTVPYADPSDTAAPTVVSIRRDDGARRDPGETTDADTLQFRVLFSKAVTNVDALDFDASGTTGDASAVAAVTGTNAAEYVVTVSNGDLAGYTGTVGLTFDANSLDIQSTAGTALNATLPTGTSYQTYKVNNEVNTVAPTVASIERHDGTKALDVFTRADALTFRVTFSEAVQNVDTADFSASGTTATASGVGVTGSRFVYDVTVMGGNLADLDATVGLTFASGQNIQDLAGNALASTTPTGVNETYTVDNTRPTVTMTGPESHDGTAFDVSVVFSEDVTNFNSPSKLAFTGGKLVNGAADITATDARTYTLRVTPNGVNPVIVRLSANGVGDAAGNGNVAAADLTVPYSVPDTTAPEVVSILRDDGAGNAAFVRTNADTVWFKVTFDEPVVNVDTADFVVRNPTGGTTTTATVTAVTGSGEVYTVTVTGGDLADFEGQVGLGFDSDQDIADAVGNVLVAPTHDYEVYVFDNTAPTVTLARADGLDTTLTAAFNVAVTFTDASFRLQTTGDGALTTDDFNVTNGSATSVTASSHPLRFTAQITPTAGFTGDVLVDLPANSVRDRAGNGNTAAAQLSVPVDVPAASEAPSDGLQARFGPAPAWHTGMAFWTELHFSAGPKLGYRDVRDKIFEVTGADIARAQRLTQGSNAGWRLLVEPDGWGDIALTLPTTTDCAAEGAVCTKEGEPLETGIDLAVPGPGDNLAAWLTGHDTRHTGQAFELELWFNRQPNLGYRDVRDRVFDVDGGTIRRARRLVQGSNLGWRLTVEPDGAGAVTLDLPPTEDCDDEAAVCSRDGDMLQQGIAVTVEGPAAFSVSDAEVTEGSDASLAFEVTLSRTLRAEARVDVATRDGTATAGADYEALAQTLVFAPDETSKTVEVTVLDDAHDEGSETMTLVLSNASGAEIADAEGTGTIVNSDAIPDAWLARFGRTVTGQVLNAVEDRLAAPRHAAMHATLAGQALPLAANETADDLAAASQHAALRTLGARTAATDPSGAPVAWTDRDAPLHLRGRTLSGQDVLTGTAFTLTAPAGAHDGAYVSLWGRGMVSGFGGNDNGLTLDGRVTTSLLGVDWATEGWTAGLSFGHSVGSGGYQGTDCGAGTVACAGAIEASLTGLYPYAGFNLSERLSLWLAAGLGAGQLTVHPHGVGALATDLAMGMGAAGLRSEVLGTANGIRLALKGDARFTRTWSEAVSGPHGNLAATDADVWLVRAGIEGSRRFRLGASASLIPSLEIGVRRDGGDAETGFGADVGVGLALADAPRGLRLDLRMRTLAAHESAGFRDWGASASLSFDPRPASDRGLSMSLRQAWGASPSGGMDALLRRDTMTGLATPGAAAGRLEATLSYGVPVFGGALTGAPSAGVGVSETSRDYRLGWRLTPAAQRAVPFEFNLDATRRESALSAAADHGVMLRGRVRW